MKNNLGTKLKIIGLLIFIIGLNSGVEVSSQVSGIREVENKSHANKQAPAECVAVFRTFFSYLLKSEPSILTDEKAQNRWLSTLLRKSFATHIKDSGSPKENPDYPSNRTFVGVWNLPMTFSIVGSRHYDYRNADNPDDNRAVIDVLYEWGKKEDGSVTNNYPGQKSLHSFVFVHEEGAWKIDDIYTFSDEYSRPGSLRSYFEKR
ncbi:MAG: hypothetical protein ND866_27220 [Pyrinomonadaceae bacterium]|nr:hypothetical protein [Pyrinomonadaceae bacterium]